MALYVDDTRQTALAEWLFANGFDPHDVPIDADLTITDTDGGRLIRCEVLTRGVDGALVLDDRSEKPATEIRALPLKLEPPEWWTPYEKPTREQLLAVVGRVRKLHPSIPGEGGTLWCQVCSQEEIQPPPVGWWVPWPCPTVAALPKEKSDG